MAESSDSSNLKNIAISFSGGGFRAASFNVGVLAYLSMLKLNGLSLLEKTKVISTVSGGTFTGVKYAAGIKLGQSIKEIYRELYLFLQEVNIVEEAIDKLLDDSVWKNNKTRSLINAFSIVYHEKLFKEEDLTDKLFGMLWRDNKIHLEEISFNSTDFNNGLYFRFQKTEKTKNRKGDQYYGIIGNKFLNIPVKAAQKIRLSDIIAASSCFPAGFEPINFPDDFILDGLSPKEMSKLKKDIENSGVQEDRPQQIPFGLMDGGIVDNQGIDAVIKAEARMNKKVNNGVLNKKENLIDLFIISDVASPYMDDFVYSKHNALKWWRRLNFFHIFGIIFLLIVFGLAGALFLDYQVPVNLIITTIFLTVGIIGFFLVKMLFTLPGKMQVPKYFMKSIWKLYKVKLGVYETLIKNRKNSILSMVNDVFLKQIRRLHYNRIYENPKWENRAIMNAVYELSSKNELLDRKFDIEGLSEKLRPGKSLQKVADEAANVKTTLWFTKEEKKTNILPKLVACGQFTLCWNLLEYIEKIETGKKKTNLPAGHKELLKLKPRLLKDWDAFQQEPLWLVEKWNKKIGIKTF